MELLELKHKILNIFSGEKTELDKIIALVDNDKSVFPFNEYEQGLYMPKFDLTYFDFIKRFNLSIDSIIGWSIFKISKLPLRRALHIKEVKDADRLNDKTDKELLYLHQMVLYSL